MYLRFRHACFLPIWLAFFSQMMMLSAQDQPTRFHHVTNHNDISYAIWRVYQTHDGFIWFGNTKGLFRFNGYEAKQVPLDVPGNQASLQVSVSSIIEYPNGTLWLGTTNSGLLKLDMYTGKIKLFQHDATDSSSLNSNFITSMVLDSSERIWLATPEGLDALDLDTETLYHISNHIEKEVALPPGPIRRLFVDSEGGFWVGHGSDGLGLSRLKTWNKEESQFYNYQHDPTDSSSFPATFAYSFGENPRGKLWVGLATGGLVRLDLAGLPDQAKFDFFPTKPEDNTAFTSSTVNWIGKGPFGHTWFGTQNRLHQYDEKKKRFFNYEHIPENSHSLAVNRQKHLFQDQDNNLWITLWSALDMISPHIHPLQNIYYDETVSDETPLSGNPFAMLKDSYGNLWVGTNKQGLMMIHGKTGERYYYPAGDKASGWLAPDVLDIVEDEDKKLWFATSWGLAYLDMATFSDEPFLPQFHFYPFRNYQKANDTTNGPPIRVLYDLEPDDKGGLWIATHIGISYFDKKTERFSNLIDSAAGYLKQAGNWYYAVKLDQNDNLWIAAKQGGLKVLPAGAPYDYHSLVRIRSLGQQAHALPSDFIYSLLVDSKNQLWVGTGTGLCKLDSFSLSQSDTFFHFTSIKEQTTWTCNSIIEDQKNNIWYNFGVGLSFIRPDGSRGIRIQESDGLPTNDLNLGSNFMDSTGKLYFGTAKGVTIFHPDSLRPNPKGPRVALTSFQLFNKEVSVAGWMKDSTESDFYLEKEIAYLEELHLRYDQSVLTFEYTALNYYQWKKNRYAYMMEGFDKDWVEAGDRRSATYTNLDPGTYYFRVKAANNNGVWNEEGSSLKIVIAPPWWQTWWAFIMYGTFVFSLFGLYLYYRVRQVAKEYETQARIDQAKQEERENVRKRSSQDFHDEAGNKLTKLSLYTELTKRKVADDPETLSFLGHIESNVRELAMGMRDFIWVLDPDKDTLADTINRLKDFGDQLFADSNTHFSHQLKLEQLRPIPLDIKAKRHLLLIFKEAMNNCLKYAEASQAFLKVYLQENCLYVHFQDNGKGFDLENSSKGNGLKNMKARAAEMGGSIQFDSAPTHGTRLSFKMEITQMGDVERGRVQ